MQSCRSSPIAMSVNDRKIEELKNLGNKIAGRLHEIGNFYKEDLRRTGALKAHRQIRTNYPDETLPICYYLYSFQGAITGTHWNDIPEKTKQALRINSRINRPNKIDQLN